jgi:hypothetical protein
MATYTWLSPTGGEFNVASNWTLDSINPAPTAPCPDDYARLVRHLRGRTRRRLLRLPRVIGSISEVPGSFPLLRRWRDRNSDRARPRALVDTGANGGASVDYQPGSTRVPSWAELVRDSGSSGRQRREPTSVVAIWEGTWER